MIEKQQTLKEYIKKMQVGEENYCIPVSSLLCNEI